MDTLSSDMDIEQYDSNGKVIDRLLISDDNEIYQDKTKMEHSANPIL